MNILEELHHEIIDKYEEYKSKSINLLLRTLEDHLKPYLDYKEWVKSVLSSNIKKTDNGNKIINSKGLIQPIKYKGIFSFDFISQYPNISQNNESRMKFKEWLKHILTDEKIKISENNRLSFKPQIKSISQSIKNYNNTQQLNRINIRK